MSNTFSSLSRQESESLRQAEAVISVGLKSFISVGTALADIRDAKLYRSTHATFADYLRERWGIAKSHGYRMIKSARFVREIETLANGQPIPMPTCERQVRILESVENREACLLILTKAKELAGERPIEIRQIWEAMRLLNLEMQTDGASSEVDSGVSDGLAECEISRIFEKLVQCLELRPQCDRELSLVKRLQELVSTRSDSSNSSRRGNKSEIRIGGKNADYVIRV